MQPAPPTAQPLKPTVSDRGPRVAIRPNSAPRPASTRGIAMTETILALPLLLLILSLIALFGFAFERYQRTAMTARHVAWSQILDNHPRGSTDSDSNLDPDLDAMFFDTDPAQTLRWSRRGVVTEATAPLRDWSDNLDDDGRDYLERHLDGLPEASRVGVEVQHTSSIPLWERFMRPLTQSNRLLNGGWRFADGVGDEPNAWGSYYTGPLRRPADPLAQAFFPDFDDAMQTYADRDNRFASSAINFYRRSPGYAGPSVLRSDAD